MSDLSTARVWLLHDGKVGLRNQAMGLAEAVGLPFADRTLTVRAPWRYLPPALWLAPLSAATTDHGKLLPPWPDLVISAGGRGAAPALAVKRASGGRCLAVQVQTPRVGRDRFDLIVAPEHDRLAGPNVFVTLGAVHRATRARLDSEARLWAPRFAALPRPRVAVLLGGGNGSYRMTVERMAEIGAALAALARAGAGLMITPSRRTGPEALACLRAALEGTAAALWDGDGANPYFGMLGLADHVLVTEDSVSMISEASATGKPVHVLALEGGSAKFRRFHAGMMAAGITRPYAGRLDGWTYQPRTDTAAAGARVRDLLRARGVALPSD